MLKLSELNPLIQNQSKSSDHRIMGDLRKAIRDAKKSLKDRLEKKFSSINSREIWFSIDSLTIYKGPKTTVSSDDTTLPNKLSDYYARFDNGNPNSNFLKKWLCNGTIQHQSASGKSTL